jgi:radical SAM protein with 4Fe4S-binding SPASM domain
VKDPFISELALSKYKLWDKYKAGGRMLTSFNLEITARCNNNCRHCFINLPADDKEAAKKELSLDEIKCIIDQAADLGALWCLLTGGEPLLRKDFFDIYLYLKKKGFLVSVFTNATLINKEHADFFKQYPPRDIEITVYGAAKKTYELISRKPGSFAAFIKGVNLLLEAAIKVRFKAMALRSNIQELADIAVFCRDRTKDYFRFDPFLHLRFDGNCLRNEEIKSERLMPLEIAMIEKNDPERFEALKKNCDKLINNTFSQIDCNHLFHCGVGNGSFAVSFDGFLRPCPSLWHPDCIYDIRKNGFDIRRAWDKCILKVRGMRSNKKEYLTKCRRCPIINLCLWCPAHAYLESGELDKPDEYFCEVAHARAELLAKRDLQHE